MNNISPQNSDFPSKTSAPRSSNPLWQYIQSLDPQIAARLSQPSSEVAQVMESNILGMLGGLPPEHFDMEITTSKENLSQLLASAMLSGYFLHSAEQRLNFEKQFSVAEGKDSDS